MLVLVPTDDPTMEDAIQAALAHTKALLDVMYALYLAASCQTNARGFLQCNQHLVKRNSVVGAEIAKAITHFQ